MAGGALTARWNWLVLMLALAVGCTRAFVPRVPRVAQGAGVRVALERMRVSAVDPSGSDLTVDLRVDAAPPGLSLFQVSVSDAREPRCLGGTRSRDAQLHPASSAAREIAANDHIEARFPGEVWRGAQSVPLRIDVVLADRAGAQTCVTLPLVDAAPELSFDADVQWSLGFGVSILEFVGGLGEVDSAVTFPITVGRWFGPVRASLSVAPGAAQCPDRACPVRGGQEVRNEPFLPLAVGFDVGHSLGSLRVGVGGAYRVALTRVAGAQDKHLVFVHGPVLTPRFGLSLRDPVAVGLPGGERIGGFVGVEIPVSFSWDDQGHRALGIGGGLAFVVPL